MPRDGWPTVPIVLLLLLLALWALLMLGLGARLFVKDLGEAPRAVDWDAPKHAASRGEVDLSWPLRPERPPG